MEKLILNYIVCTGAIFVAIALLCGGGWWSVAGFLWCGVLYVSGDVFRPMWRKYWRINAKILSYFDCL